MKHSTYLFIGGPQDGERITMPADEYYYTGYDARTGRQVKYRMERFRFGMGDEPEFEVAVFLVDGLATTPAMRRLFTHYHPPKWPLHEKGYRL